MRRLICHEGYRHDIFIIFDNKRVFIEHLLNSVGQIRGPLMTLIIVYCVLFIIKYEAFNIKMDN